MADLDYRFLGRSALKVSPLCLGAMMFGDRTDEATSKRIIDKAADQGINFIDTADAYKAGESEAVVGRSIRDNRDFWVLATKFGIGGGPGPNAPTQSRKWIVQATEASLKRLGTDYIDIQYFHRAAPGAPLEEPLRALGDLIRQGKLRYYGLSNFKGWQIAEVCRIADEIGMDRPVITQPLYNITNRTAEVEIIPAAEYYGLGVAPYSPLARGVLSGKYAPGKEPPKDSRAAVGDVRIQQTEWRDESIEIAEKIGQRAADKGITTIDFAVAWVLNNNAVSAPIAGPRTEEQWDAYMKALDVKLDAEDEAFIDALVAPGHVSTPGFTDPVFPVEGRKALRS